MTVENWKDDTLFFVCAITAFFSVIVAIFGWRQMSRRKSKIENMIDRAYKVEAKTAQDGWTVEENSTSINTDE